MNFAETSLDQRVEQINLQTAKRILAAEVCLKPDIPGYVYLPSINKDFDQRQLQTAAQTITNHFWRHPTIPPPDKITAVPNSGIPLGVHTALNSPLHNFYSSRKESTGIPGSWSYEEIIVIDSVHSFTTNELTRLVFPLLPTTNPLFVDDFCAFGETALHIASDCQDLGIKPYFAFHVAKDFPDLDDPQTGLRSLLDKGFPAYAVFVLTDLTASSVNILTFPEWLDKYYLPDS